MHAQGIIVSLVITPITALLISMGFAVQAQQPSKHLLPRYTVKDLGTLGGTTSSGQGINDTGWVTGNSLVRRNTAQRAFLWKMGRKIDLGTFGGPDSKIVFGNPSEMGEVAGYAETPNPDPLGEDFCGFGTHLSCLPFVWQNGTMTALPTLGGNNGGANDMNNRGQVAGLAENTTLDTTCSNSAYQTEPVIWYKGVARQLLTISGDPDGFVNVINDRGQAVGGSGNCVSSPTGSLHAVLWQSGSPIDLGNLGGTQFSQGNSINEKGQVIGASDLSGDTSFWAFPFTNYHGFLWQNGVLTDLGALPGDTTSYPSDINNLGQIVGAGSRAILWDGEALTDLNTLVAGPPFSPLYLLAANGINERGEIVGQGLTINGEMHAFLATPCDDAHASVPECKDDSGYTAPEKIVQPVVDSAPATRLASRGPALVGSVGGPHLGNSATVSGPRTRSWK